MSQGKTVPISAKWPSRTRRCSASNLACFTSIAALTETWDKIEKLLLFLSGFHETFVPLQLLRVLETNNCHLFHGHAMPPLHSSMSQRLKQLHHHFWLPQTFVIVVQRRCECLS